MNLVPPTPWTVVAVALLFASYWFLRKKDRFLPPGPPPLPLIGNMLDMPTTHDQFTYAKWGREYGDVVHVKVLGKHIIILNSVEAANHLLEQKSAIYSDRPYLAMMQDPNLMDFEFNFTVKQYSRAWKRQRRIFSQYMNPSMITEVFSARQTTCAYRLLQKLLHSPTQLREHLFHTSADIILGIVYGYDAQSGHDYFVDLAEEAMLHLVEGFTPKFLVNIFPILRYIPSWMPGAGFKTFAAKSRQLAKDLANLPFSWTVEQITSGVASPSFVQAALSDLSQTSDPEFEEDVKSNASIMYAAASDTSVAVLYAFILQMVLNPEIQRRAQLELDSVIGSPDSPLFRLPTFEERPKLPYIEALLKEALRWNPAAPTGLPHASMEDDEYRGWWIPKGSTIFPNAWSMLRDEKLYSEPYKFKPERFLETESEAAEPNPSICGVFGFGRRVCPGRLLAENTLWIQIANLVAAFVFNPPKDQKGNELDVSFATMPLPGFIAHPTPFSCSIVPRSKYVEEAIREIIQE